MFIDTHCHLDAAEFSGQQTELIEAAKTAGIGRIVIPSVERGNFTAVQKLCEMYPDCYAAYGIHPMFVGNARRDDLAILRDYLNAQRPVAVGEIGLDFYMMQQAHHERTFDQAKQEELFAAQLELAREFDLPVLLHIRRAQDIILKHLRQIKVAGGIAHAFNGSRSQADEFIKLGFKLGFGGAMTYPRATRLRELAATLPLTSIVLETDAPDIPPEFLQRGLPNKPEYLLHSAKILAQLRGISLKEIADATTQNALDVLPKLKSQPLRL